MKNPNLMSSPNTSRGFTLIELLVVIAIIGILSSVVLASLNTARSRGADAAIKSNLNNARAEAELVFDATGSYATVCGTGAGLIGDNLSAAAAAGGFGAPVVNGTTGGTQTNVVCNATATGWAAQSGLKATNPGFYCVDNTGLAISTTTSKISTSATDVSCAS